MLADCNLVFTILFTIECVMKLGSFGYKVGNSEYRLNDITMACYDMVWSFGNIMAHGNANFFYWIKIDRLCVLEYAYEIQTP